jgi:phosphatidylinositol 4-kinase
LTFRSFPGLNNKMTNTISRFLATPSTVFELKVQQCHNEITMQKFAIIRLAQCVQVGYQQSALTIELAFT